MPDAPIFVVTVPGTPATQGSMTLAKNPATGKEFAKYSSSTVLHRNLVVQMVRDAWAGRDPLTQPLGLQATFLFARPASHYGTGKNSGLLKASAPHFMAGHKDTDKLLRLVGDGLTIGGVVRDDDQFVQVFGEKLWAVRSETRIEVWEVDD